MRVASSATVNAILARPHQECCLVASTSTSSSSPRHSAVSRGQRVYAAPRRPHPHRSFASTSGSVRAPSASSNASSIMSDEAQLGRHFYLNKALEHWAQRPATKMTLRQLLFFGRSLGRDPDKIIKSANFVREELPIRIAQRIRDMQNLPFVVVTNKHIEQVYQLYWKAFDKFRRWPVIRTSADNERYVLLLKELLEEHLTVIPSLALGVVEVSEHLPPGQLEGFMQRMLKSRISRRVLAEQHIALSEALDDPFTFFSSDPSPSEPEHIGVIQTHLPVRTILHESIDLLTQVFAREAGLSPEEAVRTKAVPSIVLDGDLSATVSYIPDHLSFIVFELLKDAMRAVMRFSPEERDDIPLRATVVEGPPDDDLIIRISDCGGGVSDLVSQLAASLPGVGGVPMASARRDSLTGVGGATMPTTSINKTYALASSSSTQSPLSAAVAEPSASWATSSMPLASSPVSTLTDVLCSFSNVRQRLELEEEARRQEAKLWAGKRSANSVGTNFDDQEVKEEQVTTATTPESSSKTPVPSSSSILLGASSQAGLGSRDKLERLKRIGRFKGTVGEQIAGSSSNLTTPNGSHSRLLPPLLSTSMGLTDTGLGLPMAKVYAEFFGGSLNFRSLDGHGSDAFIRIPKLGNMKEGGQGLGVVDD